MGNKPSLIVKRLQGVKLPAGFYESTSFTQQEIRGLYRAFLSDCPKGSLSRQEFQTIYADFFPRAAQSESFAKHLFRSFDQNADGRLDFVEFVKALSTTQRGSEEEKLQWMFRLYDVDGNGVITEKEITQIVQALDLLSKCDYVKTGSSSAVGSCKPCDIGQQLLAMEGEERAKKLFIALDTDGNGEVTKEEFFEGVRKDPELVRLLS